MIDGGSEQLASWIAFYSKQSPSIAQEVALFQLNEDRLFKVPPEKPDFKLEFPERLTKKVYLSVVAKIFAVIRHKIYCAIRALVRQREKAYITKNETQTILEGLDIKKIRQDVFRLYGFADYEYEERVLMKSYYTYISDTKFVEKKRRLTDAHEKYVTAILICDVFPGLDKTDPLSHPDEDEIPAKFQAKRPTKVSEIKFDVMIDDDGEVNEELLDLQVD